jgi:hypothetical protein
MHKAKKTANSATERHEKTVDDLEIQRKNVMDTAERYAQRLIVQQILYTKNHKILFLLT